MFALVKFISFLLSPTAFIALLIIAGFCLSRFRPGRVMLACGVALLAICLFLPVDQWVLRPLEDRFPQMTHLPDRVDGIVVLGGAIDETTSTDRNLPVLNSRANRMTTAVLLARQYPEAKLVFTGGSGLSAPTGKSEAFWARRIFEDLGIPDSRIICEDRSRTTRDNAVMTRALVHPLPGQTWLLVTSASHMPRSVGIFRRAGWKDIIPVPAGYASRTHISRMPLSAGMKFERLDQAAHEWTGLVAYRLRGWTDSLFPAP
ncbi:YdcF family protein [Acetobacter sp. AN02]|uniref:YdcF family protein n=1 Tax=Acetobacter sp. AN02 TaxID=2894186 RepID=UPI00243468A1|nr:YdcF family protein [Acetobacter sp. AN02]MDG6095283.1 YdcF family protein [Acetobacter sp. AN02]